MTRKSFRILLVLSWLIIIAGVVASFATEISLPSELQSYLVRIESAPLANGEIVLAVVNVTSIVLAAVRTVGLFRFRRWALTLLPMSYVLQFVLILVNGPYVESGWVSILVHLASLVDGIILALVYFTPLRESFETNGAV